MAEQGGERPPVRRVRVWIAAAVGSLLFFFLIGLLLSRTVSATSPDEESEPDNGAAEAFDASDVAGILARTGAPPEFEYAGAHWMAAEAGELARDRVLIPAGAKLEGRLLYYEQGAPGQPFQSLYLPVEGEGPRAREWVRYAPTQAASPPLDETRLSTTFDVGDVAPPASAPAPAAPAAPAPASTPGQPLPAAPGLASPPAAAPPAGAAAGQAPPAAGAAPPPAGQVPAPGVVLAPGTGQAPAAAPLLPDAADLGAVLHWGRLPGSFRFANRSWRAAGSGHFAETRAMALTGARVNGRPIVYAYGTPNLPYEELYIAAAASGLGSDIYVKYVPAGGG